MADKVYLRCSAKARTTQYGEVINVGVKATELTEFIKAHTNARGYVNLTISARREVGQYGDSHSVYLDTYEPLNGASMTSRPEPVQRQPSAWVEPSPFDGDEPF